jgi:hypothetical protein
MQDSVLIDLPLAMLLFSGFQVYCAELLPLARCQLGYRDHIVALCLPS